MPPLVSPRLSTPHNTAAPDIKTPSPNYFGFSSDGSFLTDSPKHSKSNWSPPSSTVRSTAAASPSVIPIDQNPEFDAFRRQSEGKSFSLGGLSNSPVMSGNASRPKSGRHSSHAHSQRDGAQPIASHAYAKSLDPSAAETGRSPKRVLSPGSMILPEDLRRASPSSFTDSEPNRRSVGGFEGQSRFALPLDNLTGSNISSMPRADTLPIVNDGENVMVTPQHVVNLMESRNESVLLLDLRVQTQYAASHIHGALNLCIPTTLLKRPSFNVQKLAEAFKDDEQRHKFERWRSSSYIIVYDGSSALHKDAAVCINTIKKFRSEGYNGTLYLVKGGFADFSKRFPSYVDREGDSTPRNSSTAGVDTEGPECVPVMGGCPMPATDKPANPFFGNIRQNMDLIGGVGQIAVKHPSKETKSAEKEFPVWLKSASEEQDQGKKVSNKFEQIERREKKRMEDALSGHVSYGSPKAQTPGRSVEIAGLEKGNKNRYNNIWPFEHSRVKLQGISSSGCDYMNASHIKASYSNKRYISTQAPIPATFNDFWNVVWQQDVRVIVMLTAEKEGAQVKAHNYWDKKQYGPLYLEFMSEKRASIEPARIHRHKNQHRPAASKRHSTGPQVPLAQLDPKEEKGSDQPYVIVRRFTLRHEKHPFESMREITQLQYTNWPDFGAPAHPAHLLGLVEQCDAVVRSTTTRTHSNEPEPTNKRPVLVHCSAGCGRTGTFCTVDSVIDMLKRQRISQRQRETSPMDVDNPRRSMSINKKDGGSFFPQQQSSSSSKDNSVDGSWVNRDDQDLVEKTVEDFRRQRLSMVQSLRQYVLCYESIMEWLVEQHGNASA